MEAHLKSKIYKKYTGLFQEKIEDLKKMWKIFKKNSIHTFPTAITNKNEIIANPFSIAKVAIDIQPSIRFLRKNVLITY